MERFWSKTTHKPNGCIEWQAAKSEFGYGVFNRDGRKTIHAHRMAWVLSYGDIPQGSVVMHTCDNPACVNVLHLRLGTHADNVADKIAKERGNDGERHGMRKLTEEEVRRMRAMYQNRQAKQRELAAMFGISQGNVSEIINRKLWDHI